MRNIIIGADGGGTKTTLLAVDAANGTTIATVTGGSIHALSLGMDVALQNLKDALAALPLAPTDTILALSIGDPAIDEDDPHAGDAFVEAVRAAHILPAETAIFSKSDVFMALYGFGLGAPSALLIAGTGSMGIALPRPYLHNGENTTLTIGGWCNPTTDPGSGYFIAVQGINAALAAFDGVAPPTALCQKLTAWFGVSNQTPRALIPYLNDLTLTRTKLAAFSRAVAEAAEEGDAVALGILHLAGEKLSAYAIALLGQMSAQVPRLGIYGSVLVKNRIVRRFLEEKVRAAIPNAQITEPKYPPEYGACRFAADALSLSTKTWEE